MQCKCIVQRHQVCALQHVAFGGHSKDLPIVTRTGVGRDGYVDDGIGGDERINGMHQLCARIVGCHKRICQY